MPQYLRRILCAVGVLLLGVGAGLLGTSTVIADDGRLASTNCVPDSRCDQETDTCVDPDFDTWCDVIIENEWCATWTTGECHGDNET